jgi:hypothetical protein
VNAGLNDIGQVVFEADLYGTSGGSSDDEGIFIGDGTGLVQIAREGQIAPSGGHKLGRFGAPQLNESNQVAFFANFGWVYRTQGGTISEIARPGQTLTDGSDSIDPSIGSVLNDFGQVAFFCDPTSGGPGVCIGDGTELHLLAYRGMTAPDGNGNLGSSFLGLNVNNFGQVLFGAFLEGTSGGASDEFAFFRADTSSLTQVARFGQAAPDANGTYSRLLANTLNDAGQVALLVELNDTSGGTSDDKGIVLFDDTIGLVQVVREGDDLLGSRISGLGLATSGLYGEEATGLNQSGMPRIAFSFTLVDGRHGVAIWFLVPEPSSFMVVVVATVILGSIARRGRTVACTVVTSGCVLPQSELEFSFAGVSITRSEGGYPEHGQERIQLTGRYCQ